MDLKMKHLQSRHCSHPHFWLREAASMCPGRKVPGPNCTMRRKASAVLESICSPPVFCCASETCWQAPQLSYITSQETLTKLTSYKDLIMVIFTETTVQQLFFLLNLNRWHWLSHQTRFLITNSSSPIGSALIPGCKTVFHNINVVQSLNGQTDKQLKMSNSMYQLLPNFWTDTGGWRTSFSS